MKRLIIFWSVMSLFGVLIYSIATANQDIKLPTETKNLLPLTIKEAANRALLQNPTLSAYSLDKEVKEAQTLQTSLRPNPNLEIAVNDAAGSGELSGFGRSEITVQLGQLIELGGKRTARVNASQISEKLADWDYSAKRLDVLTDVNKAFIEVLKAQHKVSLSEDLIKLGNQFYNAVSERVRTGKVAQIKKIKASVILSTYKLEAKKSKMLLEQFRRKLSSTWGSTEPDFLSVVGDLFKITPVPPLETINQKIHATPYLKRWKTLEDKQQAILELEQAKRTPDITLKGGYRRLEQTNDNAISFGVSVPLKFFNRNQGAISEAQNSLAKVKEERRAAKTILKKNFLEAYESLVFAHSQASILHSETISAAQKSFDGISEGYRFGKFSFLDVLDSQKILFQIKEQYLNALADYHITLAELRGMTNELKYAEIISEKSAMEKKLNEK
jgi:cobalt-zinc-cadmium efflux system outer membrane protein